MESISDVLRVVKNYNGLEPRSRPMYRITNSVCEPDCPICGGVGWLRSGARDIHDPMFGRLVPCPNFSLFKSYGDRLGLSENEWGLDWDDLNERENVKEGIRAIYESVKQEYGWIFLWGDYGLAKTMMLKIATAYSLRKKILAVYVRMEEIMDNLRSAFDEKNPSYASQRRLDWWVDLPMLCVDEFDKVYETEFASRRRFLLMDRRYEAAINKTGITIVASNRGPSEFEGYLSDRICDNRFSVVHLTGTSYRKIAE
jgi:hypothetical protein